MRVSNVIGAGLESAAGPVLVDLAVGLRVAHEVAVGEGVVHSVDRWAVHQHARGCGCRLLLWEARLHISGAEIYAS